MALFRRRPSEDEPPSPGRRDDGGAGHRGRDQERHIVAALADLHDTSVREVMTPRVDVFGLSIPVTAPDVARAARETGHHCFPVYHEDLDNLVGVLYVNDLFRAGWALEGRNGAEGEPDKPSPLDISRRLRQPYLVPESRLVLDALADMRHDRRGFAVVVDEYGGVAGVVTTKDLLAALVGDLRDEFDQTEEPDVVRVDGRRWLVDGGTSVDDVQAQLGAEIPEGEYVTLGGYLFDAFGHIPEEGEQIEGPGGWEYRVAEMERRRVAKVVVQAPPPDAEPSAEE